MLKAARRVSSGFLLVVSRLAAVMFLNSNTHAQCSMLNAHRILNHLLDIDQCN